MAPLLFLSSWGQRLRQGSPGDRAGVELLLFLFPPLKCWDYPGPGTASWLRFSPILEKRTSRIRGQVRLEWQGYCPQASSASCLSSVLLYTEQECILYLLPTLLLTFKIKKEEEEENRSWEEALYRAQLSYFLNRS